MSRAFVNEDDQRETPFVAPRADLPEGVPNYVTPEGMEALLAEKESLLSELIQAKQDKHDSQNSVTIVNTKLQMIENRILSAQVIHKEDSSYKEVAFGAIVTLQIGSSGKEQKFQIVGVDEADLKKGKLAFTSPLAKVLMHKKAGESAILKLELGERIFKIIKIE
jgi:transcription elongation factor GreB